MNMQKIFKDIEKLSNIKKVELNTMIIYDDIKIATCYIAFFIFMALAMNFFMFAIYTNSAFLLIATIFVGIISFVWITMTIILINKQERKIIDFVDKNKKRKTK